jgi:hypothetical protein
MRLPDPDHRSRSSSSVSGLRKLNYCIHFNPAVAAHDFFPDVGQLALQFADAAFTHTDIFLFGTSLDLIFVKPDFHLNKLIQQLKAVFRRELTFDQ